MQPETITRETGLRDDYWVNPDMFSYTPFQIRWLCSWLPGLRRAGLDWPPGPSDEQTIRGNTNITFEAGRAVIAQLENMLCLKPREGMMIKLCYCVGESYETIGRYFHLPAKVARKVIDNRLGEMRVWFEYSKANFKQRVN